MAEGRDLVLAGSHFPVVVQQRLEIANSVTEELERSELEKFFREFPELFKLTLAWNYPLSSEQILQYAPAWNWSPLLMNDKVQWTNSLVIACQEFIDWSSLSEQASINRLKWRIEDCSQLKSAHFWVYLSKFGQVDSGEVFDYFADRLDFGELSKRDAREMCFADKIADFQEHWDWSALSANVSLPWSAVFISKFRERWDWIALSENEALPWTIELIREFESDWDWPVLSSNCALPWSYALLDTFFAKWDWDWLSIVIWSFGQDDVPSANVTSRNWTEGTIARYRDRWNWEYLSNSSELPWSIQLIDEYLERWDWLSLSCNESLPWSAELVDRFLNKWSFAGDEDCGGLSQNESLPWTDELIERFEARWDWDYLSTNTALPWSMGLIEKYEANWLFGSFDESLSFFGNERGLGLSGNSGISFAVVLVERFIDRWDWTQLSRNSSFQITDAMLDRFANRLDRRPNTRGFIASEDAISRNHEYINFDWLVARKPRLTRSLFRKFSQKFDSVPIACFNPFEIEKLNDAQVDGILRDTLKRKGDWRRT